MGSKRRKMSVHGRKQKTGRRGLFCLLIIAVAVMILSVGVVFRGMLFRGGLPERGAATVSTRGPANASLDGLVQLAASEFRCACGGCGELPLNECECEMPRGAREEKEFIRKKFEEGLPFDRVLRLVEEAYGHRKT